MKIAVLIIAVMLCGCLLWRFSNVGNRVLSSFAPCPDEINFQVYHKLQETLRGYNTVNAWIENPSKDALDKEQTEINRIRAWLKTATLDPCVRSEYHQWLDFYYQNGLNEAYREIETHAERRHMEEYERSTKELFDRVHQREKESPIPGPN